MAQLFGDERCTPAILEFLATTEVGARCRSVRGMGAYGAVDKDGLVDESVSLEDITDVEDGGSTDVEGDQDTRRNEG
jgi:hypothetical protein